jgi:hypothetical protein
MDNAAKSTEAWMEASASGAVTIDQLDSMVRDYHQKRAAYDLAKGLSDAAYKEAEESKRKVLEAMQQTGKQKYHVDGVGLCFIKNELVVPTPKTTQAKQTFFDWIKHEYGEAFLLEKLAIHHATLQKLYNESYKEAVEKGQGDTFQIPGLEQPTSYQSLSFRKD